MSARASLVIDGTLYGLRAHRGVAFQLTKDGSAVPYAVMRTALGWKCGCGSGKYRRGECKHVRALRAVGLIFDQASDG